MISLLQLFSTKNFSLAVAIVLLNSLCYAANPSPTKLSDVPTWAKEAVWYQIFPERFRNGDPKNDPNVSDIRGSWPHEEPKEWHISSWSADWYKLQPWEEIDNKGFYFRAQQRRYGGDLQGVIDKLDYLKKLGINAIYFNPLFESPSLHKYDAAMYHHIDNNFGPNPEGDRKLSESENPADPKSWKWTSADRLFLKLIREAHRRNIRVIIDGVFHCIGQTFWAFVDVKKNGEKSLYKDWFDVKKWDNPSTPEDEFEYESWFGVKELPELREDENGLASGPRDHVRAIVKRWMDPNGDGNPADGIDGWRLDAVEWIKPPFYVEFRKWVRAINPDAYITGELWWEDWQNDKMFNAAPYLKGDMFDGVMNYRLAREVIRFFVAETTRISVTEFDARLKALRNDYPPHVNYVLINLLDSHDTDRLSSQIVNKDSRYDHNVGVSDNHNYQVRKPNGSELQTLKLVALFQMTYLGAPTIYYGTEAGMWGADDPDERKPMLWADMKFENETHHPFHLPRPDDSNTFDQSLFNYYSKLIRIRRTTPSLMQGDYTTLLADDGRNAFAFGRSLKNERSIVMLNNSTSKQQLSIPLQEQDAKLNWINIFDATQCSVSNGMLSVELNGKSGIVLRAKSK